MCMGWEIGYDSNWDRDIGYGVPAECDHPGCDAQIDRGLAYVCGQEPYGEDAGCGLFFCENHLFFSQPNEGGHSEIEDEDEDGTFVCERCRDWNQRDTYEGEFKTFDPKPDVEEWAYHKATDPSWAEWREQEGIPA